MNFDLTKENIQPLRGGRNVSQLGLALQAESNQDVRRELQHQRQMYENMITNYHGDNPLENWYNYISWVEQSYPKNGHEGNLVQLIEQCLQTFENDKRYTHDRKFCKLWVKYIDSQQNPLEMYNMMYSKGLCTGLADLYKAWAYYHELVGDYKNANDVFELGKKALAQPYEELESAQQQLVLAAGEHVVHGPPNEKRLLEKRQALTALHSSKSGKVGSVRIPSASSGGIYPVTVTDKNARLNAHPIMVSQTQDEEFRGGTLAPTQSIITVFKRQDAPKENIMKPGPWTTVPLKKKLATHQHPAFPIHVDDEEDNATSNIPYHYIDINKKPPEVPPHTKELFDNWKVSMIIPEPVDNRMVPMYPKRRVYADPSTEYSLEELAALRYRKPKLQTDSRQVFGNLMTPMGAFNSTPSSSICREILETSQQRLQNPQFQGPLQVIPMQTGEVLEVMEQNNDYTEISTPSSYSTNIPAINVFGTPQKQFLKPPLPIGNYSKEISVTATESYLGVKTPMVFNNSEQSPQIKENNFEIWTSPGDEEYSKQCAMKSYKKSHIQEEVRPKGSAMRTPLKLLTADDLAETGSRGSTDIASAAQPMDSASTKIIFEDNSDSSYEEMAHQEVNTQVFNFNLNAMKVSTPQPKQSVPQNCFEQIKNSKKQLFEDENFSLKKPLSVIMEESKNNTSSSCSSGGATKSSLFSSSKPNTITTISEEHSSYLAQNLMANEALRKSLLGDLLPTEKPSSPIPIVQNNYSISTSPNRKLDVAPSDPFKSSEIEKLLKLVSFPGPHVPDFYSVSIIPRISGKKEYLFIGQDQFFVEKFLGKGTFGAVYKAFDARHNKTVALKHQKPANKWEFYISREIQNRLRNNSLKERFMNVTCGYFDDQASILVYPFMSHGSLLDLANLVKIKTRKPMQECLCFYFSIQMLKIVEAMHQVKIIHADIKPDNFLIQLTPDNSIELQLIDFGCSIDMSLYPPNTAFTRKITTENFICCEMQENKPWNYHTDIFCIAATSHVLLFDKYLELQKKYDAWNIKEKIPRYMKSDLWNRFFNCLLNQQNEIKHIQDALDEALSAQFDKLTSGMKTLVNYLNNR